MKTTQKQTVHHGNLRGFPKFAIPPELLVLRELKLLEISERFGPLFCLHQIIPQHHRD
jgi:hypothetical protein